MGTPVGRLVNGQQLVLNLPQPQVVGYFPYAYNEDWFFFETNRQHRRRIIGLDTIGQQWRNSDPMERVKFEQFGDIIAMGIKDINFTGFETNDSLKSHKFWTEVYYHYLKDLNSLSLTAVPNSMNAKLLKAARGSVEQISVKEITDFCEAYATETSRQANGFLNQELLDKYIDTLRKISGQ